MAAICMAVSILSAPSCSRRPLEDPPVLEMLVSDEWTEAPDPLRLPVGSSCIVAGSFPITISERGSSGCISLSGDMEGYTIFALKEGSTSVCLTVRDEVIRSYTVIVYAGDGGWNSGLGFDEVEPGTL